MKYLKVFTDFVKDMSELGYAERGRLFTAMLIYADSGEETVLCGNERFIWGTAKKQIDSQREAYEQVCKRNKDNATSRYQSLPVATSRCDWEEEKEKEKEKEKKIRNPHRGRMGKKNSALQYPQTEISKEDFDALVIDLGGKS